MNDDYELYRQNFGRSLAEYAGQRWFTNGAASSWNEVYYDTVVRDMLLSVWGELWGEIRKLHHGAVLTGNVRAMLNHEMQARWRAWFEAVAFMGAQVPPMPPYDALAEFDPRPPQFIPMPGPAPTPSYYAQLRVSLASGNLSVPQNWKPPGTDTES